MPSPLPRKRRARTVVLVVLACVLVAIVAVGVVAVMSRKSLSDAEMAYAGKVVEEPTRSAEYYMIGTAMAAQRQAGALTGRTPTAAARAKAKAFFGEGDAYYRKLLALESPSELFDESHSAFLRAVGVERRLLTAIRVWYNDPWGDKGEAASHTTSRLFDKAKTADDRSGSSSRPSCGPRRPRSRCAGSTSSWPGTGGDEAGTDAGGAGALPRRPIARRRQVPTRFTQSSGS